MFSTTALPDNRDADTTSCDSPPLPQPSRRKVELRRSTRLCRRSLENIPDSQAEEGPSACLSMNSKSQLKLPKPKLDLKALFDYHFRRKKRRRHRNWKSPERKKATTRKAPEKVTKSPRLRVSAGERKRRCKERALQFPFVQKLYGSKDIPFTMVCQYEQAALKEFLKYIEMQKFEHHLKKALTQLNAGDDLEKECLESRKHKYLDDDEPLSPIEETDENDQDGSSGDTEGIGAKIVENSCFILSSKIPKKKKSKRKTHTSNCELNNIHMINHLNCSAH